MGRGADILNVADDAAGIPVAVVGILGGGDPAHQLIEMLMEAGVDDPQDVAVADAAAVVVVPAKNAHEEVEIRLPGIRLGDDAHLQGIEAGQIRAIHAAVELLGCQKSELLMDFRLVSQRQPRQQAQGQRQSRPPAFCQHAPLLAGRQQGQRQGCPPPHPSVHGRLRGRPPLHSA